jgi:hypothetical protein
MKIGQTELFINSIFTMSNNLFFTSDNVAFLSILWNKSTIKRLVLYRKWLMVCAVTIF